MKSFIDALPNEKRVELLYQKALSLENGALLDKVYQLMADLNLLDLTKVQSVLEHKDFDIQKKALKFLSFDKPFYNAADVADFQRFCALITQKFPEKYPRSFKKQLLSSKEKEIWTCDCNNNVEIGKLCGSCKTDIFGFRTNEVAPPVVVAILEKRVNLIKEYIQ
ncbi:MAG: hypothetical protein EOO18_08600 [Chryseobacterium sp.]|nr:MAG: hypothetical protein EOO18_08600 [Chryseobacterium sp.]